jgi:iron complex outermembrane receptor protein
MNISQLRKRMLEAGVAVPAIALLGAGFATPAYAQDDDDTPAPVAGVAEEEAEDTIVVTGSLFRRTNTETASPVTSLSAETLEERGINTAAEAVQRIPSNNAGTIQQGWNTGFNFASGANAPALRGLTVQSTLSIADGLRIAPYPLADDGQRNFVDLNTIPNAIIERIEILRDGASSTYGSDAIAGVINVITKKEIQGLHLNGSYGMSQEGDADEFRVDATWGYGDLDEDGFNFYVSGEWQKQDALFARDREYPFNSQDLTGICGPSGSCMPNHNWNGVTQEILDEFAASGRPMFVPVPDPGSDPDNPTYLLGYTTANWGAAYNGLISTPGVALVRRTGVGAANPVDPRNRFQYLNPAAGCRGYDTVTITPAMSNTSPLTACEVNFQNDYIMLQPEIERRGVSGRLTFNVGERHQVYAQVNWYNTLTHASFTPLGFNGTPTPPNNGVAAYNVILPVYVCPTGVGTPNGLNTGCTAANGTLNPYNPFAAEGARAQLNVRSTRGRTVDTDTRTLRGVLGIDGEVGNGFFYTANFTASEVKLRRDQGNYLIPQRIMDVIARGTFNFNDLEANSQEVWDYIAPLNSTVSTTDLWQAQVTVAKELFELPGGPLQVAVGGAYREESINAPSANPATLGNQYDRYYSINSVGTAGSRNVKSGFFEIDAPVVDMLELSFSGRYDDYSTGQSNFSPKAGIKFTPIPEVALRGTWSKGFRVPSFNEAFGLPTTGYITQGGGTFCDTYEDFADAHGDNTYACNPFNVGLTSVGNPALEPEKSTAFTAGIIVEPIRNVSFTADFWHIKVKNLIGPPAGQGDAIEQYYTNNGVVTVPGYTAIPGAPDPAFPNALPHLGFLVSSFTNQDQQVVSGLDFGINVSHPITDSIRLRSVAEASWLMKYELTRDNGTVERYEGTLSPCNITSCSGAPEWRATWQNSLDIFDDTTLSLTVYYTDGYGTESIDFGSVRGDCTGPDGGLSHGSTIPYVDGTPVNCTQPAQWNADFNARHKINDVFTVYLDVLNVFDIDANFDPSAAYSLFNFNPAWSGPNMLGRYFRIGAKVDF